MAKDLLTHVLVLLPLETVLMFMLKNAVKKKIFEKIGKNKIMHKSPTLSKIVSCSEICDRNYQKQNYISKGLTPA